MILPALRNFEHWDLVLWAVIILAWSALEILGLVKPNAATFSSLVRAYVPPWARAMIVGWLFYHFLIQAGK